MELIFKILYFTVLLIAYSIIVGYIWGEPCKILIKAGYKCLDPVSEECINTILESMKYAYQYCDPCATTRKEWEIGYNHQVLTQEPLSSDKCINVTKLDCLFY